MATPRPDADERGPRVDAIVAAVRERLELGEAVAFGEVLAEHPDLETLLSPRLAVLRLLHDAFEHSRAGASSTAQVVAAPVGPGDRVGPYEILSIIGAGGMGTVCLAEVVRPTAGLEPKTRVALKLIHPHLLARPEMVERFRREARAGARLKHAGLVSTLDTGHVQAEGVHTHYLAMEFVEGRSIREVIQEFGNTPEAYVREVAIQVAGALEAIHEAGMVHRDLKPENVLVTDDQRVCVMDLGMARLVDATVALTREGEFAGSLLYAAPEQLRGDKVGPAADLYATGVLLYEMLAGERPFGPAEIASAIRTRRPTPPPGLPERGVEVTPFFAEVVHVLLAEDPDARFSSAAALREVLLEGEPSAWWTARRVAGSSSTTVGPSVRVSRSTEQFGRDAELGRLREAWRTAQGGAGTVVLIQGASGVGKTRLVAELIDTGPHEAVLYASFGPSTGPGVVADALAHRFGSEGLEESLRPYLRLAPALAASIARFARRELLPGASEAMARDTLQTAVARLLQGLAREQPELWILEDIDGASPEARGLALALARAAQDASALLVLTAAESLAEGDLEALSRLERFDRVDLGRLPRTAIEGILDALFADDAAHTPLGRELVRRADGVPSFLFELLRGLEADGAIERLEDGRLVARRSRAPLRLPQTLRHGARAALARLRGFSVPVRGSGRAPVDQRALLDLAAVHGFAFDAYLLADVLEQSPIAVLRELAEIERRVGIVRTHGRLHQFDHVVLQEVLYEELAAELRLRYHGLLAVAREHRDGVSPDRLEETPAATVTFLARHHLRGDHPERARPYLRTALDLLAGEGREEEALETALAALAVDGLLEGEVRAKVSLKTARRLLANGRRAEARELATRTLEQADADGPVALQVEAGCQLAHILLGLAEYDEAGRILTSAHQIASALGDAGLEADVEYARGRVIRATGNLSAALSSFARSLDLAHRAEDPGREVRARNEAAVTLTRLHRFEEALAHDERCITIARRAHDLVGEGVATTNLGTVLHRLGRYAEARACHERCLAIAREGGDRKREALACGNLGNVAKREGDYEAARRWHERDLAIQQELGDVVGELAARINLASVWSEIGGREDCRRACVAARTLALRLGRTRDVAHLTGNLGLLAYEEGRYAEAEVHHREALEKAEAAGDLPYAGLQRVCLAWLLLDLGDADEAAREADTAEAGLRQADARRHLAYALFVRAVLLDLRGDAAAAEVALDESLALHRALTERMGVAETLVQKGEWAARAGDVARATEHLDEALDLARRFRLGDAGILAAAWRAGLPGGSVAEAVALVEDFEELASVAARARAHHRLAVSGAGAAHQDRALALLGRLADHAPTRYRESFERRSRLHEELVADEGASPADAQASGPHGGS